MVKIIISNHLLIKIKLINLFFFESVNMFISFKVFIGVNWGIGH